MQPSDNPRGHLVQLAAGYVMNYLVRGHDTEESLAHAEHMLGVQLTPGEAQQAERLALRGITAAESAASRGPTLTLERMFPFLATGSQVDLRFLVRWTDPSGNVVSETSVIVTGTVGVDTVGSVQRRARDALPSRQSAVENTTPSLEIIPNLPVHRE